DRLCLPAGDRSRGDRAEGAVAGGEASGRRLATLRARGLPGLRSHLRRTRHAARPRRADHSSRCARRHRHRPCARWLADDSHGPGRQGSRQRRGQRAARFAAERVMLRSIVAFLLLVNIAFFVWSQGWVDGLVGVRARGDHEPDRLAKQVRPESVRLLTPQAVADAASAAESGLTCLEAGPFDDADIAAAESAASQVLPAGTWSRRTHEQPARWIVYMGRYANREAQQKKEQELSRIKVAYEEITGYPAFEPGLSLGRYPNRNAADEALQNLSERGVHTGKVIELAKAATQYTLRVDRADQDLATKVSSLKLDG